MGTLPKRVPMTLSTFSFSRMPLKMHGICRENTSMTSRSFCVQHAHQGCAGDCEAIMLQQ